MPHSIRDGEAGYCENAAVIDIVKIIHVSCVLTSHTSRAQQLGTTNKARGGLGSQEYVKSARQGKAEKHA